MVNRRKSRKYSNRTWLLTLGGCLLFLLCLLFFSTVALGGLYLYLRNGGTMLAGAETANELEAVAPPLPALPTGAPLATLPFESPTVPILPSATPIPTLTPIPPAAPVVSKFAIDAPSIVEQQVIPDRAYDDLDRLYNSDYPVHDYYNVFLSMVPSGDLSAANIGPRTYQRPEFQLGDRQVFRTPDGNIEATLAEITEHAYFWTDDDLNLESSAVHDAGLRLETEEFYGQFAHTFGQPWQPGMDGDSHFSIVHLARNSNEYEVGSFSKLDEYPNTLPLFNDSNQQEIIYLNMERLEMGSELYFGTLIHELQHLSQWSLDKNESVWLNEGLAQLAEQYVGLDTVSPDAYLQQPDTRLDNWEYEAQTVDAHYANSFLFLTYIWEQLQEQGIYELVRQPENGLSSVRKLLQGFNPERSIEQFLADWAVANYLDDPAAGNQYSYTRLDLPAPKLQDQVQDSAYDTLLELDQLSVHYIGLNRTGTINLAFAGDTTANLTGSPPSSGEQMWYALPGNDTHSRLTATFDLRQTSQATLEFNTWFELEDGFDFAYVTVSTDQGATWTTLSAQHSSPGTYGPAFSGRSTGLPDAKDGWIHERIALNDFIGQKVMVSFQVLTDFEATGQGFAIDDIAVPEIGYSDDVETFNGEWQAEGFVRTGWLLPQVWSIQIVQLGTVPQVTTLQLDEFNQYQGEVTLGADGGVLIIMPLTPFTLEKARYWLEVPN